MKNLLYIFIILCVSCQAETKETKNIPKETALDSINSSLNNGKKVNRELLGRVLNMDSKRSRWELPSHTGIVLRNNGYQGHIIKTGGWSHVDYTMYVFNEYDSIVVVDLVDHLHNMVRFEGRVEDDSILHLKKVFTGLVEDSISETKQQFTSDGHLKIIESNNQTILKRELEF